MYQGSTHPNPALLNTCVHAPVQQPVEGLREALRGEDERVGPPYPAPVLRLRLRPLWFYSIGGDGGMAWVSG